MPDKLETETRQIAEAGSTVAGSEVVELTSRAASPSGLRRLTHLIEWLRSPDLGLLGQGMRYVIAGGIVAAVSACTTLVLSQLVGLHFQVALAIGFTTALVTHFTLQRFFVWVHHEQFALPLGHQLGRYLTIALAQYGLTALGTAVLPRAIHISTPIVYICLMLGLAAVNFILFRGRVFHPGLAGDAL